MSEDIELILTVGDIVVDVGGKAVESGVLW